MFDSAKYNRVYLDSSPFIYFIEENPRYISVVEDIFFRISYGNITGACSYLALLEVLIQPLREGAGDIAAHYKELMLNSGYLEMLPLDDKVAETAAELRAKYDGLKTPDAIHLATGILSCAQAFVTNDKKLKQVKELDIIILDDII